MVLLLVLSLPNPFAPIEDSDLEKIEFGTTIHAFFNEFKPIHIPLQRTVTPGQGESCKDCVFVLLDTSHKGLKCLEMSGFHSFEPSIKLFSCALTHPRQKFFDELIDGLNLWACLSQQSEKLLLFLLQILCSAEKEPGS